MKNTISGGKAQVFLSPVQVHVYSLPLPIWKGSNAFLDLFLWIGFTYLKAISH